VFVKQGKIALSLAIPDKVVPLQRTLIVAAL
jgi:hypothetical protein